jgi:hypothetical protein
MTFVTRTAAAHTRAAMIPRRAALFGTLAVAATMILPWDTASAGMVATVNLGTSASYSVLGASTVTNTGPSVLDRSLGLYSGTDITGFDAVPGDGIVNAPGTIDKTNAAAQQAQADLTAAYLDAAGRPSDMTLQGADLTGQRLLPGVWGDGSTLSLSGTVTLDGAGSYDSVFIIQTGSTLITGPGSTVALTNGAQACNVFWVVPTSATLDTGSTFAGNILALASISLNDSVTVNGRALAQTGAVTLINDRFTASPCLTGPAEITTFATPVDDGTTTPVDATAVTVAGTTDITGGTDLTTVRNVPGNDLTLRLPETGRPVGAPIAMAATFLALGALATWFGRRKLAPQG